jgi:hypothetical protein
MNEPKPVYCIKSRGGRVEKEGTFAEIVAWLEERRIQSDDELRRLGFYVLEKDELWAQVRDFPEFKLTERQGRQGLSRAKRRAYWATALGIVLAAIGSVLIIYDQLIPRYTESSRVGEAQTKAKVAQDSEAEAIRRQNAARGERDTFKGLLEKAQASLNDQVKKTIALQAEIDSQQARLRDQGDVLKGTETQLQALSRALKAENDSLKTQLAAAKAEAKDKGSLASHWMDRALANEKSLESARDEAVRVRDYWKSLYETERKKSKMEKLFGD